MRADAMSRQGAIHHLRGNASLDTSAVSIRADEIDYNQESNVIEAHGEVRVKLKGNPSYFFVNGAPRDRQNSPYFRRGQTNVVEIMK